VLLYVAKAANKAKKCKTFFSFVSETFTAAGKTYYLTNLSSTTFYLTSPNICGQKIPSKHMPKTQFLHKSKPPKGGTPLLKDTHFSNE
jgi:hypothetical protein